MDSSNSLTNSKSLNENNLLRSDHFEELLENIEADAEICPPSKSIVQSDSKQKKKSIMISNKTFMNLYINYNLT